MAVVQLPFVVAVLLLVSPGLHCSAPPPACPESCTCQRASLLNCSASGLSSVPQPIQDYVTGLDLSQNRLDTVTLHRPYRNLRNVWLENNTITRLSLCIDPNLGTQSVRGRHSGRLGLSSRRRCVSWAPALQLLSVERNQLIQLPEGLERSASLWVLQLSFNRISTLRPGELRHLRQLKELHLKHNLITSLHPQMFQDLSQLRVLDLSFNMLTNLHPSMYLSLHTIGSDVRLDGNRWQCDCSMRSLRRRMAYDSNRGLQTWGVVCAFPSVLSGKDLLQLEEDDLNCFGTENSPELHRDVTVYSGSEILLSCSKQDSLWWTPSGQESVSGPQASLLIGDVTDKDTGLYVCMTEDHEVVSVFNLQISRVEHARRKTRSLPRNIRQVIPQITTNRIGQERNQGATQSDLALAVCLSVFITFLIAFILGVLARPFIEVLCSKITNKRNPTGTNSVSSSEQRQYDNEAYSEGEEPEEIVTHRERRVTFRTVNTGEDINVEYYDTVAGGNQQSVEATNTEEDEHTAGDSGCENGSRQINPGNNQRDTRDISGTTNTRRKHRVQFDNIPDSEKLEERSLSSCSDSSLSDRELKKDRMNKRAHTSPKSLQRAEDSVQQGADSTTSREISELSSEPFADWSPHADDTKHTDSGLWQENEEQFEFSDSVGSNSARSSSLFGSFNYSKRKALPNSDIQSRDDVSSCSSSLSADEPTQYTVNPDQEEEDTENNHNKSELTNTCPKQDASFQQQISGVDTSRPPVGFNQGNYPHDTLRSAERPEQTSSSQSSDSEQMQNTVNEKVNKEGEVREYYKPSSGIVAGERDTREKIKPMPRSRGRGVSVGVREMPKTSVQFQESHTASRDSDAHWPALDLENKIRIKRRLDIKAPPPSPDSSSGKIQQDPDVGWPALDLENIPTIKRRLDVKVPSPSPDSSSSNESDYETTGHTEKTIPQKVHNSGLLLKKSQTANQDPDARWPALDLEDIPTIKRRLDVTAPSPPPDSSSSSDSDDETTHAAERPGKVGNATLPLQKFPTATPDPDARWPALDLEHIPTINRRLDVKAPSPSPDSSSSSDSEDETPDHTEKTIPQKVHHSGLLLKTSPTANPDLDARWPALDLENIPTIKRRLDIKAPSPHSDSSSSSASEDETKYHTENPEKVDIVNLPLRKSQTLGHNIHTGWPALDLENIPTIKRRLDVKAPSPCPDSSSSSDSEDETTGHTEKTIPQKVDHSGLLLKTSPTANIDPDARWPALDLLNIPTIKRRLDVKTPSAPPDSSSSSDSDDETIHAAERPGKVGNAALQLQKFPTATHDPDAKWPALDLENIPTIKRRLDVKAPSPRPDSSSSSDSEDETTGHTEKTIPQKVDHSGLLLKTSPTANIDPDARWPALDLLNIPTIKRRLDVTAPSPPPDSSSSSDSDDETTHAAERPGKVGNAALPLQKFPTATHDPDARWPALDLENIPTIKRRLDVKAPSPRPDSSSSSDSEDETTGHTEKTVPQKVDHSGLLLKTSPTANIDPDARWPALDLLNIPTIKRRLDVTAPSPPPDSSSSSDSDDETIHAAERPGKVGNATLPLQTFPTATHDPDARWPALDLEHIPTIKRRLDVKAPSPRPDSSSSSDSDDETTRHTEKTIPQKVDHSGLLLKESQIATHGPDARWPALDLLNIPTIKRRLDVTAPSPPPDSSSSSDSDDETIHAAERPGKVGNATLPLQTFPTATHDPDARWPALDLEHIPTIKRRLDVKAPSPRPDSSSSSDSDDETTRHTEKTIPQKVDHSGLLLKESQIATHGPDARWPALDLLNIPTIKRRLDVTAPSPPPDSSSSSDSDDETIHAAERPGKVGNAALPLQKFPTATHDPDARWPALDLENIPTIKRRLDVKAPSPRPDSSSSSDSEDETTGHTEKTVPQKVNHSGLLLKTSQTANLDPDARWPALDLENIPTIKRRLDIKAPSPHPDSSSSSDSDDETIHAAERPGKVGNATLPLQKFPTATHDPDARWPALDLLNIPTIKRRLDVTAPSPSPDSSSSSDSEDETIHAAERPGKVGNATLPLQKFPTATHDPDARWPALDLENIPTIKRRLDVKAPSPRPDSSSSSDSEDETTGHAEKTIPQKVDHSGLLLKESQTANQDTDARWPALDLENIPTIKRRLDIKAPSPPPDSSSSSDSDNETTHAAERPGKVGNAMPPLQKIPTATHDPDARWPALDLLNIPTIKRRLDVKAPSPSLDSSSSSDSEDETTGHTEKKTSMKFHHSGLLLKESQIANRDLDARWPALNLENIPTIKRRLDIKAPSPDSNSSSSSDNEEDITHLKARPAKVDIVPIKKHEQVKVNPSTFLLHKSETVSYDPLGSAVNLNHITRIKRRLDIKAPSSPPKSLSDERTVEGKIKEANKIRPHYSSSSSVEQDKYTEDISNPSMTIKPHPDPRWPELGLSSAPRIKRHLDIKTHSPSTESSSSSDKSDSESTHLPVKVERDRTVAGITNYYPVTKFSDMKKSFSPINRRLNIRGPPQPADSSFSSSANGTLSSHTEKHEMDKDGQEQQKVMHNINLGIPKMRRRLDIKAPSPQPDLVLDSTSADGRLSESNSSSSESEDENRGNKVTWSPKSLINISPKPKTDHTIKLEKYTVITDDLGDKPTNDNISPTLEINPELQSRWNNMNLGVSRFRKRLDITSQKNVPPNLPTTPLPDSPSSYTGESGTGNKTSRTRLKKNLVKVTEEKSNPDNLLTGLGTPRVRSYLDTKVREKAPVTSPLHQQSDSVSSSESEGISTEYADYTWRGRSQMSVVPDVAAPQNRTSLLGTHAADESHSGIQVERKAGVELKSQASEEGDGSASMWPHLSLTNIPKVKRALDIKAPLQRESFPSSNSEDETDHTVPELKPGVPRISRSLNIKAPSPEPNTSSSSSSESDNEVTGYSAKQSLHSSNMTAMTDDDYSQIAYKRTIIKAPRQRNSFSPSGRSHTSDHPVAHAGLSHREDQSIKEQSTLDVSPEIRWTGIGRNLPDFSSASRRLNLGVPPPERAPAAEPELTPPDSSEKIKRDRVKAYESLMHRFSYPSASRGSVASSRSLDKIDNTSRSKSEIFRALSEDRKERKGLGALKAISSERRQWDTDDKDKDAV